MLSRDTVATKTNKKPFRYQHSTLDYHLHAQQQQDNDAELYRFKIWYSKQQLQYYQCVVSKENIGSDYQSCLSALNNSDISGMHTNPRSARQPSQFLRKQQETAIKNFQKTLLNNTYTLQQENDNKIHLIIQIQIQTAHRQSLQSLIDQQKQEKSKNLIIKIPLLLTKMSRSQELQYLNYEIQMMRERVVAYSNHKGSVGKRDGEGGQGEGEGQRQEETLQDFYERIRKYGEQREEMYKKGSIQHREFIDHIKGTMGDPEAERDQDSGQSWGKYPRRRLKRDNMSRGINIQNSTTNRRDNINNNNSFITNINRRGRGRGRSRRGRKSLNIHKRRLISKPTTIIPNSTHNLNTKYRPITKTLLQSINNSISQPDHFTISHSGICLIKNTHEKIPLILDHRAQPPHLKHIYKWQIIRCRSEIHIGVILKTDVITKQSGKQILSYSSNAQLRQKLTQKTVGKGYKEGDIIRIRIYPKKLQWIINDRVQAIIQRRTSHHSIYYPIVVMQGLGDTVIFREQQVVGQSEEEQRQEMEIQWIE